MNDKELNEQLWQHRISEMIDSGKPRVDYCLEHDISATQMLYWMGKRFEATSNLIPVKVNHTEQSKFTPAKSSLCEFKLANGHEVKVNDTAVLGSAFTDLLKSLSNIQTDDMKAIEIEDAAAI